MGLLIIDETKCKKDGICARECPMVIIKLKDGNGFPEMVPGGETICNNCGHCVAVCANGALSHAGVPIEQSPLIEKEPADQRKAGRAVPPLPPLRALLQEAASGKGEAPATHRDRPLRPVRRQSPTGGMDSVHGRGTGSRRSRD